MDVRGRAGRSAAPRVRRGRSDGRHRWPRRRGQVRDPRLDRVQHAGRRERRISRRDRADHPAGHRRRRTPGLRGEAARDRRARGWRGFRPRAPRDDPGRSPAGRGPRRQQRGLRRGRDVGPADVVRARSGGRRDGDQRHRRSGGCGPQPRLRRPCDRMHVRPRPSDPFDGRHDRAVLPQPPRGGSAGRARGDREGVRAQRGLDRARVAGGVRRGGDARVHHAPGAGRSLPEDGGGAARSHERARGREPPPGGGRGVSVRPRGAGPHQWRGVVEEYRERLPVSDATPVISLGEGGTPLVRSDPLSLETGCDVWLKYDGANPTGSFKDRGMTLAISKAVEGRAKAVVCASTGNTSASAAAYAARAGLTCAWLVPKGKVALGKMAATLVHGARMLEVDGNFDASLDVARDLAERFPVTLVNSVNPFRLEGQKTAAFEICDALGRAPDVHCLPVGNAGNITAYWKGYSEYASDGVTSSRPTMRGFQAAGAAPIVTGAIVAEPSTIATAIRIGNPASWQQALAARDESGGAIESVTDKRILEAYRLVAREEGVFVEPASAASVAGLLQTHAAGALTDGQLIVCTVTGHGLKDPEWAISGAP